MTDGMLLREAMTNPMLEAYKVSLVQVSSKFNAFQLSMRLLPNTLKVAFFLVLALDI